MYVIYIMFQTFSYFFVFDSIRAKIVWYENDSLCFMKIGTKPTYLQI